MLRNNALLTFLEILKERQIINQSLKKEPRPVLSTSKDQNHTKGDSSPGNLINYNLLNVHSTFMVNFFV